MPAEAADKLQQLYNAADKLRQKIDAVDEKSQNSSVKMTRRLLDQTERQIASLRANNTIDNHTVQCQI